MHDYKRQRSPLNSKEDELEETHAETSSTGFCKTHRETLGSSKGEVGPQEDRQQASPQKRHRPEVDIFKELKEKTPTAKNPISSKTVLQK